MFDFDRLAKLADNPTAFEAERALVIKEFFDELPEDKREKYQKLQRELDLMRANMPPAQFMGELFRRMQENLLDLNDQLNAAQVLFENKTDVKPRLGVINRVALTGPGFSFDAGRDTIVPK